MSATQSWFSLVGTRFSANIREDGPIVIAVGRCNEAPARPHGQAVFLHQPHDLLVVHDAAFVMQLGSHTPVAVRRPLGAYRLDLLDKPSFADRLELRLIVVCRARESHQPTSFCD